jgi:hypothetical protein
MLCPANGVKPTTPFKTAEIINAYRFTTNTPRGPKLRLGRGTQACRKLLQSAHRPGYDVLLTQNSCNSKKKKRDWYRLTQLSPKCSRHKVFVHDVCVALAWFQYVSLFSSLSSSQLFINNTKFWKLALLQSPAPVKDTSSVQRAPHSTLPSTLFLPDDERSASFRNVVFFNKHL